MEFLADESLRLDKFLAQTLPGVSRTKIVRVIHEGLVLVNGVARRSSHSLSPGDLITLPEIEETPPHELEPIEIPLDIGFEDEYLAVINKPRGLASHPSPTSREPTLVHALLARSHALSEMGGSFRPGIVHRLDKDTTGLMVIAKTDAVHDALSKQIQAKTAERRYVAVIAGDVGQDRFTIDAPLSRDPKNPMKIAVVTEGRPAITHIKKLLRVAQGTLVAVKLQTGRTHQIRVHLSAIGHPVLGDRLYAPIPLRSNALQLHSAFLSFIHPVTLRGVEVFAEPPLDFIHHELVSAAQLEPW